MPTVFTTISKISSKSMPHAMPSCTAAFTVAVPSDWAINLSPTIIAPVPPASMMLQTMGLVAVDGSMVAVRVRGISGCAHEGRLVIP
jgi:hypothetical protein